MASQTLTPADFPTWNLNPDKDGIEIRFDQKPPRETLDTLKAQGFRWSLRFQFWYGKDTDGNREFAALLAQDAPIKLPRPHKPTSRKRTKPKYLVVLKGKRKPKVTTKRGADFWMQNPAGVRVLYRVPGEWTAEKARQQIKREHPRVKILLGEHQTKAAQRRLAKLLRIIQDLEGILTQFNDPPGAYRIVIFDTHNTEYKYNPRTQTADKITAPALTEGVDRPLKALLARSKLFVRVQVYDDMVNSSRGPNIRGLGRTLLEQPLGDLGG